MNRRTTWVLVLLAVLLGGWLAMTERRDEVRVAGATGSVRFRRLDPREVISVEILRSNVAIRLERTNSGWFLRSPIHYPVQSTSVERLLEMIGNLAPRSHQSSAEVTAPLVPGGSPDFRGEARIVSVSLEKRGAGRCEIDALRIDPQVFDTPFFEGGCL